MTDDLVKRLRQIGIGADVGAVSKDRKSANQAADRIEELNRAVLDLAQYVSRADLGFYIEPETRKVLNEIGEKKDD
jgi:hypothetical protein